MASLYNTPFKYYFKASCSKRILSFLYSCPYRFYFLFSGGSICTIEEIVGVMFVHNESLLWVDKNKIPLELAREIGGLDETVQNYILFQPKNVAFDNAGNIFVIDAGNYRVQKYDPKRKFPAYLFSGPRGVQNFR